MTLMLRYAARSDVGLIREGNQDSVYAGPRLLAVADGMGGQAAGDVASRVVIAALEHLDEDAPGADLVDVLRHATRSANDTLRAMVEGDPKLDGMGTTLTAMLFSGSRIGMVHVGDSRAYVLRNGTLTQITHDDTYVQSLIDEGRISADEASTHPQRSLLLRALTGSDVDPNFSVRAALPGDRYLLCSDGLSGVVSEETISEALADGDPRRAADRLVDLALRGGAPDNVTCVVADVVETSVGDDEPVLGGAVAEGRDHREPSPNSPAGRAALARPRQPRPAAPAPTSDDDDSPRHARRWALGLLIAVVLLAVAGWFGWRFIQSQYYVGAAGDGTVSVFRGVTGTAGGLRLHRVEQRSNLTLPDLQPVARRQVRDGITATSRNDADSIIQRLRGQQLPLCPTAAPTPTPSARLTANPTAAVKTTARPTPARAVPPRPTPTSSPSPARTPSPSPSPVPGQDCRSPHS